jgi:hypothetical protein
VSGDQPASRPIEPNLILTEEEYGCTPEQTHADFPTLPVDTILKMRAFARQHQDALQVLLAMSVERGGLSPRIACR